MKPRQGSRQVRVVPPQTSLSCRDVDRLPLIIDPHGSVEVVAPGSVYQPLLLASQDPEIAVGPGSLDEREEAFVRDLILHLYGSEVEPPRRGKPLMWGAREIWIKRNIEKRHGSFRVRVEDSDWFYPDFVLWILDYDAHSQTIGFVDPKGLVMGAGAGWSDYKIVCTAYMPHVLERRVGVNDQAIRIEGGEWTVRIRGVIVSTSSFGSLAGQGKFELLDESAKSTAPSKADFRERRVLFQEDPTYIQDVLKLLTSDTAMDEQLAEAARLLHAGAGERRLEGVRSESLPVPNDKIVSEIAFIADLLRRSRSSTALV